MEDELSPTEAYRAAEPHLKKALKFYNKQVTRLLVGQVPEHYVIGRVKTARSLIRKLREEPADPRSWASITDKVGLRVICTTKADCKAAAGIIRTGPWTVTKDDRKRGEPHEMYYQGIHLDIEAPGIVDHTGEPVRCEVQIRTRAQDAWSVASHKLTYKGVIQPPKRMERLVKRLTILMEVFDDEIHRLFKKRAKLPMYAEALTLEHLEGKFEEISDEPAEGVKDLSIVGILMQAYSDDERPQATSLIDDYCAANHVELAELVHGHGVRSATYHDNTDWLFTQPEVLIVLERASAKRFLLLSAVSDTDLEGVVRSTCVSAGLPLPE